jgi:hypothetical protein
MSPQADFIVSNGTGAAVRSDLNVQFAAIVSNNSGATEPATMYAYQWWADTTAGLLKIRNAANNAWVTVGTLADANLGLLSLAGGTLTGALLADDAGTAALPAIAFDGDPNTGIFRAGADQLGIATNGTARLTASTTAVTSSLPIDVPLGSVGAPSLTFTGDLDTGIYSPSADQLGIATNGVERVEFGTTEVVFNDGGADVDFRIEGDTNPDLFKIDAGLDEVQVANLNGGPLAGTRNRIINGNYDVWQRGTSFSLSASVAYTADRWEFGGTGTVTRQAFSIGQTDVPGEPTYFAEWNITSNSQNYECVQKIEDVRNFAGGKLTVSFYAKRSSGTTNLAPRVVQYFGTGGSPSGAVATSLGSAPALTTSWQKFVYTIDVPSIAGKTIGTDNNNSIWISLQISNTATGTIQLAQVQAEPGSTATPFERRSYGQELALCQRYYEKTYSQAIAPGDATGLAGGAYQGALFTYKGSTAGVNEAAVTWQYKVVKRAVPTITFYAANNGTSGSFTAGSTDYVAGINGPIIGDSNSLAYGTAPGGGNDCYFQMTASAEL